MTMSAVVDRTSTAGTVALAATAVAIPAGGPVDLRDDTVSAARAQAQASSGAAAETMDRTPGAAGGDGLVPYPERYRAWQHVKSELVEPGNPMYASVGGLHHIYANDAAMAGYSGGQFADGSVIVFDLLDVASEKQLTTERARKSLWVMRKDARQYAASGGWGFEKFTGDSKTERTVGAKGTGACYGCHAKAPATGVFSRYRP